MLANQMAKGSRVIIWGRPEPNLILLFGEGTYETDEFINGNWWPAVRLTNGREMVVHQHGISIGKAEAVADTCKRFQGDVIEWDIDAYLRGEKPTVEQRVKSVPGGNTSALPPPKTATDKVMYLKQEIEMQEGKIKVAEKVIADAKAVIATKKKEIADLSQTVLTELASVNPDILKMLAAQVAEQMKANGSTEPPKVMAPEIPVTVPHAAVVEGKCPTHGTLDCNCEAGRAQRVKLNENVPPVVVRAAVQPDQHEVDHTKLATED